MTIELTLPIPNKTVPDWKKWDWQQIFWRSVEKRVFNLQKRIYKVTKLGQRKKVHSLTKLLMRSSCAVLLGIRRVTQDNQGKKTAGIDGKKYLTPVQRRQLAVQLMKMARLRWKGYKSLPIKRKFVPKPNGKQRPLGIPVQRDRVVQYVVKAAIEPMWEAEFGPDSYGFRPAMSTHDAIDDIFRCVNKKHKWVLDADIKGCFDNINHQFLLKKLLKNGKSLIKQWLKRGVMEGDVYQKTDQGTPQGGIISPLLANIVLDGMESYLRYKLAEEGYNKRTSNAIEVIRYADDFVVLHEDLDIVHKAKDLLTEWLKDRGLTLSDEKTKIISVKRDGFDFLGFEIKQYQTGTQRKVSGHYKRNWKKRQADFKVLKKPSKKAIKKHKEKIALEFDKYKTAKQEDLIERLNPIIRGWSNYYKGAVSSQVYKQLDHYVWQKAYAWAKRRHPNKSKHWAVNKYFKTFSNNKKGSKKPSNRKWWFASNNNRIQLHSSTRIKRHIKVRKDKSYYDGDTGYWAQRLTKGYDNISPSKAKLLRQQKGQCPVCQGALKNTDLMETHHERSYIKKGVDYVLALLHRHCHDLIGPRKYGTREVDSKRRTSGPYPRL